MTPLRDDPLLTPYEQADRVYRRLLETGDELSWADVAEFWPTAGPVWDVLGVAWPPELRLERYLYVGPKDHISWHQLRAVAPECHDVCIAKHVRVCRCRYWLPNSTNDGNWARAKLGNGKYGGLHKLLAYRHFELGAARVHAPDAKSPERVQAETNRVNGVVLSRDQSDLFG